MPPSKRKRSPAQLAAAARGTKTIKWKKLNATINAIAALPEHAVDDLFNDMHTELLDDVPDLIDNTMDYHSTMPDSDDCLPSEDKMALATPANDWHNYIKKYMAKGRPQFFCTFTTENCEDVD